MKLSEEVKNYTTEAKALIGDVVIDHVHNDIAHYFNLTPEEMGKMDKEDCVQAQYFIMQYSISISKKINNVKSSLLANQKEFNRAMAKVYNDYNSFNGAAMIHASACNEHEHLREMDNEITKLEALLQEYEGLSFKSEKMVQIFRDLSFCR